MTTRVSRTDLIDPIAAIKADWARRDAGEACEACGAPIGLDGKHMPAKAETAKPPVQPKAAPGAKVDTHDVFAEMKAEQERQGIR
jgi:hypothetical protein